MAVAVLVAVLVGVSVGEDVGEDVGEGVTVTGGTETTTCGGGVQPATSSTSSISQRNQPPTLNVEEGRS